MPRSFSSHWRSAREDSTEYPNRGCSSAATWLPRGASERLAKERIARRAWRFMHSPRSGARILPEVGKIENEGIPFPCSADRFGHEDVVAGNFGAHAPSRFLSPPRFRRNRGGDKKREGACAR